MYDRELIDIWFNKMITKEILEVQGAISNEMIFMSGAKSESEAKMHRSNLDNLTEYLNELKDMRYHHTRNVGGGYGSAIRSIMESNTNDYYKQETIHIVRKDGDSDYYKAVSAVADNSNDGYYMFVTIKRLGR